MPEPSIKNPDLSDLPHILVVDDDDRIRSLVSRYLNDHGFLSFTAPNAVAAKEILTVARFDALVVDVMMPGQDGREFTRTLRLTDDVPVLLLTAMGEVEDRLEGLGTGADDYLTKPFDPRELVLRLQAILRRRPRPKDNKTKYKIGPWLYDPDIPELQGPEDTVRLTEVENTLLKALCSRHDTLVSREELAEMCALDAGERTIDVQVTRLRRKLEEDSKNPRYLQTVRGKGYLLRAQVQDEMERGM